MGYLLLAPHGDDETLFASYITMRKRAHVIVCSQDADPNLRRRRTAETARAIDILGTSHHEWPMPANAMDWDQARTWLELWNSPAHATVPEKVYAPNVHPLGHEQHNQIGQLALEVFGDKVVPYTTYAPRGQRESGRTELVPDAGEIAKKLQALACYETQIGSQVTRPWFFEMLNLREWLA